MCHVKYSNPLSVKKLQNKSHTTVTTKLESSMRVGKIEHLPIMHRIYVLDWTPVETMQKNKKQNKKWGQHV